MNTEKIAKKYFLVTIVKSNDWMFKREWMVEVQELHPHLITTMEKTEQ